MANDSYEEYVQIGDISRCEWDNDDLQDFNHSIDAFDIVPNASTILICHEDQIISFENSKDDKQIYGSTCNNIESAADTKGSSQLPDLQTKVECNIYEEEDDESNKQFIMHVSMTEVEHSTFKMEITERNQHK